MLLQIEANAIFVCLIISVFNIHTYIYILQLVYKLLGDWQQQNHIKKNEWMLRWKYFKWSPQNTVLVSESRSWIWTLGPAVSTIPVSEAPGSAEFGSEASFGTAACDSVPPEIQATLLQFRQRLKDSCSWMSSYWTTKGGRAARGGEKSIKYTEPILSAQPTCSVCSQG